MVPKFSIIFQFILFFFEKAHTLNVSYYALAKENWHQTTLFWKVNEELAVNFTLTISDDLQIQLENTMKNSALNI